MYATGALANIRAYDPSPKADPALEEALRMRRLRDVVEAMQSRKSVDKIHFYASRWVHRRRAAKRMQSISRGWKARKVEAAERRERESAAVRLQAGYRGRLARGETALEKAQREKAAAMLQAHSRGLRARREREESAGALEIRISPPDGDDAAPADAAPAADTAPAAPAAPAAVLTEADAPRAVMRAALVVGTGHAALSAALAARCGGSVLDLAALTAHASATSGVESDALLAASGAAEAVPFALALPVLVRAMGALPAPHILSAYPRAGAHIAELEAAVDAHVAVGIRAVCAPDEPEGAQRGPRCALTNPAGARRASLPPLG